MAKGFVAGFLKRDDAWIRHWVVVDIPGRARTRVLEEAKSEILVILGAYCGGEAVARRKTIFVDAICPDGRELLETFFEAVRIEQPETDAS